jgi:hypothetical protein
VYQQHQPRFLREMALYDEVFQGVLGHSSDVRGDLTALHLPRSFAPAAGTTVVSPGSVAASAGYPEFLREAGYRDVMEFYAEHPLRLFGVANRGLDALSATRPTYLGNYEASSGAPQYARECRICISSAAFTLAEPMRWVVLPGLWSAAIAFGGWLVFTRRRLSARARATGAVLAAAALGTVAQFWVVALSDGDGDLARHMVFTVFGTTLLGPLLLAALAALDEQPTILRAAPLTATASTAPPATVPRRRGVEPESESAPAAAGP